SSMSTLSLPDALPLSPSVRPGKGPAAGERGRWRWQAASVVRRTDGTLRCAPPPQARTAAVCPSFLRAEAASRKRPQSAADSPRRSEEHTSELQSRENL